MSVHSTEHENTVLVLAPTNEDVVVALRVLQEAGIEAVGCVDADDLCAQVAGVYGAAIVAEEALSREDLQSIKTVLERQPTWSDIPIIFLTSHDSLSVASSQLIDEFSQSGSISFLERPFARVTLVRAAQVALRARKRQYQVRALLEEQRLATQKRDDFFATLSHELRTPLTVILGWLEVLRKKDATPQDIYGAVEILLRNAQSQKTLIDDLLDTSRIITGKLHVDRKPESLSKIVRSTTDALRLRAKEAGLTLVYDLPEKAFPIEADDQRLAQVIANLITNAIKFTPAGGRIEVALEMIGQEYVISVHDTGRGIDPSFLPFIFDRMKQEDMSSTRENAGMGLGLAIAAYIVREHDGRIIAESEGRGQGTTMSVHLPIPKVISLPVVSSESLLSRERESLTGIRVLVVDDSPDILSLVHLWLKKANAVVKTVTSASQALEVIADFKPDVLLSDIGMPGEDGYSLIKQIRNHHIEGLRSLPAAALTAYARDEERSKALEGGFQMHIAKPMSEGTLKAAVVKLALG